MSFFYDASLVQIPSGISDGTLYSVKPIDGSGDLTFSRGSDIEATRVNSQGYIEKAKVNLVLRSNTFSTTWVNVNSTETGGQSGYDGTSDAWLLTDDATIGFHSILQYTTWGTALQTGSVYVKAGTNTKAYIGNASTNRGAFFNLSTGTLEGVIGTVIAQSIVSVGSGWYRISVTLQGAGTFIIGSYQTFVAGSFNLTASYSGSGSTILIQDAQLNYGLVAQDYVETTTAAVVSGITDNMPRLNYDPANPTCPSLLLEGSRSNIHTNSEYLDAYVKSRATITTNASTSPEGVTNASKIIPLSTSTGWAGVNAPNYSFTSGQTYSLSVFCKAGEYNYAQVGGSTPSFPASFATINLTNGVVEHQSGISATTEDYGNGWWRISFTHTAIATASSPIGFLAVYSTAASSRLATQVGDDVSGIFAYGWQAELGSYPTSYIPTYGSSATRTADACSKTGISSLIGQTEGTLYWEGVRPEGGNDFSAFSLSDGTTNNEVFFRFTTEDRIEFYYRTGGTQTFAANTTAYNLNQNTKIAFAYKANDVAVYVNGNLISTGSPATTPTSLTQLKFERGNGTIPMIASVNQAIVFKTRLSNADLATLTSL